MGLLASGIVALIVAMGIGRFAYTPILPLMKNEAGLGDAFAGVLAAANYLGYFAGALWSARPFWRTRRVATIRWALAAACATTLAMGFWQNGTAWLVLRFASGVASAFVLILVSSVVLDRAAREGRRWWPGLLYAGVGLGIVLTGALVPAVERGGWRATWFVMGALSALLCALAFAGLREPDALPPRAAAAADRPSPWRFWTLMLAYCGDGIGYVIPATFIVAILRATPELAGAAAFAWIVVGLLAAPSPLLWDRLAARFGRIPMLALALAILAAGVVAPVYSRSVAGALFSAAALGLTFMGITALVNTEARALFPHSSSRAIGELTAAFGIGQIVGPLIVSAIALRGGSYESALLVAGAVLAASVAMLAGGRLAR